MCHRLTWVVRTLSCSFVLLVLGCPQQGLPDWSGSDNAIGGATDRTVETRYVSPDGVDDADGLSAATALRSGPGDTVTGNRWGLYVWNFGTATLPSADILDVRDKNVISGNTERDIRVEAWILSD